MADLEFLPEWGEENPTEQVDTVEQTEQPEVPVEETITEEDPVEEPSAEDLKAGPVGLEFGTTDGQIDKAKLTTPIDRAVNKIPILGQINQFGNAAGQGVNDFIFDAIGMLPGGANIDSWWDKHNPKSDDPVHTLIRDASAIIVPTIAGGALIKSVGVASQARHIPTAQRTLGNVLAYMGLDTSIAAISSQSYEQDNMAGALNEWLGWNLPWATNDTMGPDQRRHMHIYEAAGFSGAIDLLGITFAFAKKLKAANLDPKALNLREKELDRISRIWQNNGTDPITEAVESRKAVRKESVANETRKRLGKESNSYDPFINEPARVEQRAIDPDSFDINANLAKGDLYQIQNNIGTIDGIMRPSAAPSFLDELAEAGTNERGVALAQFFEDSLSANSDIILNGKTIPAAELNKAVDTLTQNLFNDSISFEHYKKVIEAGKVQVFQGEKFLSNQAWLEADAAWTRAHKELFDPNNFRSSAMLSQQAADVVSTTSKSLELLDGIGTSSRQWELISKKMKFLVSEVTASKEVVKRSLELKELVRQNDPAKLASWLNDQAETFSSAVNASKRKAFNVIDEIEKIAKENPNYMRPLAEAYDLTNGDVDTLFKLHKWTEANIGFWKKAFFDREPELPSMFVQGINSIRYNSALNGLAPLKALVGNSVLSTIKPISVFAGAAASGDVGTFKRAMYTYGGISENIKRAFKVLNEDLRRVKSNPQLAVKRGRHDIRTQTLEKVEVMDTMAEAWRREGKDGKVMAWNMAKAMTHWTNWKFERWGISALYSIDGFLKSLMASGNARASAYDTLFEATNGSFTKNQFQDLQRHIYHQSFGPDGTLKSAGAQFDTDEIALNLDNIFVEKFEKMSNHVPALKALFMFPRTQANGFEIAWSFSPLSNLGPAVTRARRTLQAQSVDEIAEVMMEHGRPNNVAAFKALQAEYVGRQMMGTSAVMGAGMWALEGNLTGNGPQDKAERARMMRMGWKPRSIKNPFTGKWHSYQGVEPIEGLLSLTADIVYQAERVDQSITEDAFNKVVAAITLNISNDTLAGGLEPLYALYSGNEGAWNRFLAQQAHLMLPNYGLRSVLNNVWTPQLKDVKNDFLSNFKNKGKAFFRSNTKDLPDLIDVYTGQPIKFHEPLTAAANALLPFFKQNGGMEDWRQWLLATGWDGLSKKRVNTVSGGPLEPFERQWINNWIGKHGQLRAQVIDLMNKKDDKWAKELHDYKKALGIKGTQQDFNIKNTLLHRKLDEIHERAFRSALRKLKVYYRETGGTEFKEQRLNEMIKGNLGSGNIDKAAELRDQLLKIRQ